MQATANISNYFWQPSLFSHRQVSGTSKKAQNTDTTEVIYT